MSKYRFELRAMTEADRDELVELVAHSYGTRETITQHFGESVEECFENYAKPVVYSAMPSLSFVCVDHFGKSGNEIIGCILCTKVKVETVKLSEPMTASKAFEMLNNEFKQRFLELHKDDEVQDHMSAECLCVKDEYEEKSIASKLSYLAVSNAKKLGYGFVLSIPTVHKVKRFVIEKMNARRVCSINYDDVEYNGVYFFKGITDPKSYEAYEVTLADFDYDKHSVELEFDY